MFLVHYLCLGLVVGSGESPAVVSTILFVLTLMLSLAVFAYICIGNRDIYPLAGTQRQAARQYPLHRKPGTAVQADVGIENENKK